MLAKTADGGFQLFGPGPDTARSRTLQMDAVQTALTRALEPAPADD